MFYLGLDLGKLQDFTALAVVEREDPSLAWSPSSIRTASTALLVRHLERAPLGTPYTRVVERVKELTRHRNLNGLCYLTVDSTGVGVPVVESLRAAPLGCRGITAVTITGGDRARQSTGFGVGDHWHVPRTDLLSGIQMLLEKGELKISKQMKESGTLVRELISMRAGGGSLGAQHDDLVLAVSLACWQATRPMNRIGTQRLSGI